MPPPDAPPPDPDDFVEDENDMRSWEMKRPQQYASQTITLGNWLSGINRPRNQPKITEWTSGKLCPSCSNFDIKSTTRSGAPTTFSERYAFWNYSSTPKAIRNAAKEGCKRCVVLGQVLHMLGRRSDEEDVRLKFLPASVALFALEPSVYLEIFPSEGEPSTACGFPPATKPGRRRFGAAMGPACLEEITMAINECIFSHHECRPSSNPTRPNRLVEIPAEDGQPVRIIKAPADAEYTALSHCWGKEPLKRLLKQDVAAAEESTNGIVSFAWADLPPSFRDACTVSRGLFMQYIWIDSLCIIQDDSADWQREAAKMGSIYESAYVTISATDAAASAHGFLFRRFTESGLTAADGNDRHIRFTVRQYDLERCNDRLPHYGDTPDHPWLLRANDLDEKYRNPLQLRGWCFQERLMSRRVLHVKRYEIVLECNAGYRCECSGMKAMRGWGVKALVSLMMQETLTDAERFRAARLRDAVSSEHGRGTGRAAPEPLAVRADARLMQAWEMLVELYSRTAFTHRDDVLPALGSLARVFQAARPGWTYVAGMWTEQLRRGLMWVPLAPRGGDGEVAVRTNAQSNRDGELAPSFSWAARCGRMRYMAGEYAGKVEFEVISAVTTPSGEDTYGDIVGGELRLRGRAVAFRFWKIEEDEEEDEGGLVSIKVEQNDWDDPECSRSRQDVEVCFDITAPEWQWRGTNKVESGIETLQTVKGFDTPGEAADFFDKREPHNATDGLTEEEREHLRDMTPLPSQEPLIMFRLTSGCEHGMRGVGAAALMLRRSTHSPGAYRRVGLRILKDQVFHHSPEMELRIV